MKLLYIIITLVIMQITSTKLSGASFESKSSRILALDILVQLYQDHMFFVDKDYAEKSKNLSKEILKDTFLQQATTSDLSDFRQCLIEYINGYDFYQHYRLYNKLVEHFAVLTMDYYYPNGHQDEEYIAKLLKKQGYNSLNYNYENDLKNFMTQFVLTKFEKFSRNLPSKEFKLRQQFQEWFKELKECKDFSCYDDLYDSLVKILYTPKEILLRNIKIELYEMYIEKALDVYELVNLILKDPKLEELDRDLKKNFIKDINYFKIKYETNENIDNLNEILKIFDENIKAKYYDNTTLPRKQRYLLKLIFNTQGYVGIKNDISFGLGDFIKYDLPYIFENFWSSIDENERQMENELANWYDRVLGLTTYEETMNAFDQLTDLKKIKLKEIITFQPF